MSSSIEKQLKAVFRGIKISAKKNGRLVITALPANAKEVLKSLKDEGYIHLALISCVDWIDKEKLELVYILSSYFKDDHVILRTSIPRKKPRFITMIDVFENAEPYEHEAAECAGTT